MKVIFTLSFFCIFHFASAQVFETVINTDITSGQWTRMGLIPSNDKGYILFCTENYLGSDKSLIKIDSIGNIEWTKKNDYGFYGASPIGQNRFALYDILWIPGWPDTIYMKLVLFDSSGMPYAAIAIPESLEVSCMHPTSDGGTIASGHHIGYAPQILFKTDSIGNFELMKLIDSIPDLVLSDVIEAKMGGYIGVGDYGYMDTIYHYRQMIIRLNNSGDTIWTRTYFNTGNWGGWKIYNSVNDEFLIVGNGSGPQGPGTFIMNLDSSGNILWIKGIPAIGIPNMTMTDFVMTSDSNFVFAGYSNDGNYLYPSLLKTDTAGNFLWMRQYPAAGYYEFRLLKSDDGGFVIGAYNLNGQIVLIKTDSSGASLCDSLCALPLSTMLPLQIIPNYQNVHITSYTNIPYQTSVIPASNFNFIQLDMCLIAEDENISAGKNSFTIYPNPATNKFDVDNSAITNGHLEIFNSVGEKIYSSDFRGQTIMDSRQFPKGIYFVQLINENNRLIRKLIIE